MSKLTVKEKKWLNDVQKVLNKCPSDRLGFYTTGYRDLTVWDKTFDDEITTIVDNGNTDWPVAVVRAGADFDFTLWFPSEVEGVAG